MAVKIYSLSLIEGLSKKVDQKAKKQKITTQEYIRRLIKKDVGYKGKNEVKEDGEDVQKSD